MEKRFDGKKTAKLGTDKNPAIVSVQTEERVKELAPVLEKNGWTYKITVDADAPEDINDLEILLNPIKTSIAEEKSLWITAARPWSSTTRTSKVPLRAVHISGWSGGDAPA
jgi:hypothetical protein